MNIYRKIKFSDWLKKSLLFIRNDPWLWLGYTLFVALILCLGRASYALGIFSAVVSLFVGVGIAKYSDLKHSDGASVGFIWAIKKSLPLAILAGMAIVLCWFIFSALANILDGHVEMITYFFFDWQYTPENLNRLDTREIAIWLYGYANIALIFTLLMFVTFASWFSYPLMLFKDYTWSQAKEAGKQESGVQKEAFYKMLAFLIFEAFLCAVITPLLTPVLYVLASIFMFVSYKTCFERS